jgi:glutamine amidotransferase
VKIAIADYGAGNLGSLASALNHMKMKALITRDKTVIDKADIILLPGVGSFSKGMNNLVNSGLEASIKNAFQSEKRLVGICLGMHLFAEIGFEGGRTNGLGFLPDSNVQKLPANQTTRIPHLGWDNVIGEQNSKNKFMYFAHSYFLELSGESQVSREYTYAWGNLELPAVISYKNIRAAQFHPEKSGDEGLHILREMILC